MVGIRSEKPISAQYKFGGELKLEFLWHDNIIETKVIDKYDRGFYLNNDLKWFREITFTPFEIPLQDRYRENIALRVTVMRPDKQLSEYSEATKLYVNSSIE